MNINPLEIRDLCRKGLIKYLIKAISIVPKIEKPLILDMGCGSGVTTLALADIYTGNIYAVDSNKKSLSHLEEKIKSLNLSNRIKAIHGSVFKLKLTDLKFDIILAEGLLNIIGFEKGMQIASRNIKENGYFIIHDEIKDHNEKLIIMEKYNFKLLNSFELGEDVWWNDYYKDLEKKIKSYKNKNIRDLFRNDIKEIEMYKKDPIQFRSIYYILKKHYSS